MSVNPHQKVNWNDDWFKRSFLSCPNPVIDRERERERIVSQWFNTGFSTVLADFTGFCPGLTSLLAAQFFHLNILDRWPVHD